MRAEPLFIRSVVAADGSVEESDAPQTRPVLDPRVAYLVTSLMEDVINHGTGVTGARAADSLRRPRERPALRATAGSRDYTSNLLCVVWVGFDDNRDLGLSGGAVGRADLGRSL